MKTVTVGTARNQFRVAQFLNLSMVTFIIGLSGNEENLVSLHHLLVSMALLTDFRMELLSECHHFGFVSL